MAVTARCSKCGAPVSDEVAGGFCTACLLEEGLAPADLKETPVTLKYFGDYELIEEIARGGMGVVFKARQRSLNRIVAVKMILSGHLASEVEAQRFRAEARAAAVLQHPGIVAIHEVGEHEGLLFFSMDYVEGQNLAQLVRDGPLSATRAAQCVREIAEAIHYAHERGVLHRDLKPSNVLIDASGKPHVTDFGLAKRLVGTRSTASHSVAGEVTDEVELVPTAELTVSGQVLGSPNFMPPEQAAGKHRELTLASDVYSLGALLYHLLTGRPPFLAENIPATLRLVSETEPVSPRLLAPAVPRDLETICLKCLEKDPQRRYATAKEFGEEIQRFLNHEPIRARPIGAAGKMWRWARRNPGLARTATAALVLFLAVTIGGPIALLQINDARKQAEAGQKEATLEAVKSQQVAQFLKDMLKTVGPSVALGRDTKLMREILENTAQRIDHDLQSQPAVAAELRATLGRVYRDLGDYTNASAMHRGQIDLLKRLPGERRREIARALYDVGEDLRLQGRQNEAEPVAREALELHGSLVAGDDLDVARSIESIALIIYFTKNKQTEGESLLRQSLEMKTRLLGRQNLEVATTWHNLGIVLDGAGNFADAESAHRQALDLRRQLLGNEHPDVASSLHSVAWSLYLQGRFSAADGVFREALDMRRKLLSEDHPDLAKLLLNIGSNLRALKQYPEAEKSFRQALAISEKRWGTNHAATISPVSALAGILRVEGKLPEAEQMYRRALAMDGASYGNWLLTRSSLLSALVDVLRAEGKRSDADALIQSEPAERWRIDAPAGRWKEAAASLSASIESAPNVVEPYLRLAPVLLLLGDEDRYRQLCQQIVARFSNAKGMPAADTVAKACSLHPGSGVDLTAVSKAADTALALGRETEFVPWFQLGKALSEYRLGHFAEAVDWAKQAHQKRLRERDAAAYLITAMAQAKLKQPELAREAFGKGSAIVENRLPSLDGGNLGVQWHDVVIANLLLREARDVVQRDVAMLQAQTDEALKPLRQQVQKLREANTNESAVARELAALADDYTRQKKWNEAELFAREGLKTQKKAGVHPSAFRTFVVALAHLSRTSELSETVRDHIADIKNSSEKQTLATASLLKSTAWDLDKVGEWDAAASCARQAFAIEEQMLRDDLKTLSGTLSGLCAILERAGNYAEAEPLMQRRIEMVRKRYGNDDSHVSEALSWLAIVYEKDVKFAESAACARDGLAIQLKLGTNNPSCLIRLVRALRRQNKDTEADGVIDEHLSRLRQTYKSDPIKHAETLNAIANTFVKTYEAPAAEKMLQETLAIQRQKLTNGSPEIVATLERLCYALEKQKKTNEAAALKKDLTELRPALPATGSRK